MPKTRGITRAWFFAIVGAVFAGCSVAPSNSGAAANALPLVTSNVAPTASASPWPSSGSFVYRGTIRQTRGRSTVSQAVVDDVSVTAGTVDGRPATMYDGEESQTSDGKTLQVHYVATTIERPSSTGNGDDVALVKSAMHDSNGLRETVVYGSNSAVFDQLPEVPQARWQNVATRTDSISDAPEGWSLIDRYGPVGAYEETGVPVEGRQSLAQTYPDGNAVYQWPFEGAAMNSTIAFSPPAQGSIPVLFTNAALKVTETLQVPTWYRQVPPVLAADSFVDAGRASVPEKCSAAGRYAQKAMMIVERSSRLDVVYGQYETTQRISYVAAPYGVVCADMRDELVTYYNYATLKLHSKPISDVVTEEVLALSQVHAQTDRAAAVAAAAPLGAAVRIWSARVRLQTLTAIYHSLHLVRNHA